MSEMKKIHVGLYGDGSRDARLREEIIYCDHADECSLYRDGKCLKITSPFASYCPLGKLQTVDGGTKRSKAFQRVGAEARADECHGKLKRAYGTYFAVAGDYMIVGGMSLRLEFSYSPEGGYVFTVNSPGFCGGNYVAIPKSEFTVDVIKKIYDARPIALIVGLLKHFRDDQLPFFLLQLKKEWSEKYMEFVAAVPQAKDLVPNYVGKWARVSTLNRDVPVDGLKFDGDYLVGEFRGYGLPFGARFAYIRIPITDDLKTKITSNDQVTEETIFE